MAILRNILNLLNKNYSARFISLENHNLLIYQLCKKEKCLPIFNSYFIQDYTTSSSSKITKKVKFDYKYLCDEENTEVIRDNILKRKSNGNIDKVISLRKTLMEQNFDPLQKEELEDELYKESLKIPNISSPHLYKYGEEPHLIRTYNKIPHFNFKPVEFHALVQGLKLLTFDGHFTKMAGPKSYSFNGDLANLERALIKYSVSFLLKRGFTLISVPDLLYSHVIERCGMQTKGVRSQVYHLTNFENEEVCLSGTAEMGIGGYLEDQIFDKKELPLKFAAVSRCFRQELGGKNAEEKGIFRVPQFNKVEMFGVTANETGEESEELYQELLNIQTELYSALDFHFQVLDMPINDLGDQAYKKVDIEAWIPVQRIFGEISSVSNCGDYQSRRLDLKYRNEDGDLRFAHTVNGTACATPRVLISMVSSNQTRRGEVLIPEALQPFFNNEKVLRKSKSPLVISHFNSRTYSGSILKNSEELEADSL